MNHPKLIHRVWLGPNIPDPFFASLDLAWAAVNPGWEVRTWGDREVERLDLSLQPEYDAAPTYVHRADIVMAEVVARFGGVAVGYDMEPLRPLETLCGDSDGWCTPDADGFPGGGLFGARPGHPGILAVIVAIAHRIRALGWVSPNLITGPYAWQGALGEDSALLPGGLDVLGTTATAYPIHYSERELLTDRSAARARAVELGAHAIHYFAGTWLPESGVDVTVRGGDPR